MGRLLADDRVDAMTARYGRFFLLGLALGVLAYQFDGLGAISAFMAIWLGACGGTFRAWRTERGLWMLSGLFLMFSVAIYSCFQYNLVWDFLNRRQDPASIVLDSSLGTYLLFLQARLLTTITIRNWQSVEGVPKT